MVISPVTGDTGNVDSDIDSMRQVRHDTMRRRDNSSQGNDN